MAVWLQRIADTSTAIVILVLWSNENEINKSAFIPYYLILVQRPEKIVKFW